MSKTRRSHHFLQDEQGDWSLPRVLLVPHIVFNWAWMWLLLTGVLRPPDSEVLTVLIGSLDVTIFMVLGSWAAGPRIARYLLPQVGAVVQGAGALVGRLNGTDNRFKDDERGEP